MKANYKVTQETPFGKDQTMCIVYNWHALNEVEQQWNRQHLAEHMMENYGNRIVAIFKVKNIKSC